MYKCSSWYRAISGPIFMNIAYPDLLRVVHETFLKKNNDSPDILELGSRDSRRMRHVRWWPIKCLIKLACAGWRRQEAGRRCNLKAARRVNNICHFLVDLWERICPNETKWRWVHSRSIGSWASQEAVAMFRLIGHRTMELQPQIQGKVRVNQMNC